MKKSVTIFILLLFIVNIAGYYIPFFLIRSYIRNEMNNQIKNNINLQSILTLTFPLKDKPAGFVWIRKQKEFQYNNEMYDIVKTENSKDKITYYCLKDNDEKNLNDIFYILIEKNHTDNGKRKYNYKNELSKYTLSSNSLLLNANNPALQNVIVTYFYKRPFIKINLPPPKFS